MNREIDTNSGAAPQPGGWAGIEGAAHGHALPGMDTEVEQESQLNEVDDNIEPEVQEAADEADETEAVQEKPAKRTYSKKK